MSARAKRFLIEAAQCERCVARARGTQAEGYYREMARLWLLLAARADWLER